MNIEQLLEEYRDNDYYNLSKIENITKLCEEIEKLNIKLVILTLNSQYLVKQNDELEEVINNAIEYIEQHNDYFLLKREVKKVLEILKGVDKE